MRKGRLTNNALWYSFVGLIVLSIGAMVFQQPVVLLQNDTVWEDMLRESKGRLLPSSSRQKKGGQSGIISKKGSMVDDDDRLTPADVGKVFRASKTDGSTGILAGASQDEETAHRERPKRIGLTKTGIGNQNNQNARNDDDLVKRGGGGNGFSDDQRTDLVGNNNAELPDKDTMEGVEITESSLGPLSLDPNATIPDPLFVSTFKKDDVNNLNALTLPKLPLQRNVSHLGVLLDAGRHYFPTDWIRRLLDILHRLGYTLLHFRLTDDQAFNIRLKSQPDLAQPAPNAQEVYTPEELRELVVYAFERNITIMPEINVPGHAGGWAGRIPSLVVPCAMFLCTYGYGLPLNLTYPGLRTILTDVLQEVKEIFQDENGVLRHIHLGGDEFHMSFPCFEERGFSPQKSDIDVFENMLGEILEGVGIDAKNVMRWESTAFEDPNTMAILEGGGQNSDGGDDEGGPTLPSPKNVMHDRSGGILHYWRTLDYRKLFNESFPFFVSTGLYFDTNQNENAWTIFENTRKVSNHSLVPIGITAGTFELGVDYWVDRNVIGRLLAVAMGASDQKYESRMDFVQSYNSHCAHLGFPSEMCRMGGFPPIEYETWRMRWSHWTAGWKTELCGRLGEASTTLVPKHHSRHSHYEVEAANNVFWQHFPTPDGLVLPHNTTSQVNHTKGLATVPLVSDIPNIGLTIDLELDGKYVATRYRRLLAIVDYMSTVGFNTLQLRIMNEFGFAVHLRGHKYISVSGPIAAMDGQAYPTDLMSELVEHAAAKGIRIIPEITTAYHGGGWAHATAMAECPNALCGGRVPLVANVSVSQFLPTLASAVRGLREIFNSDYIHLGYDERVEAYKCYAEAGEANVVDFNRFEKKLEKILRYIGLPMDKVLRYDNTEGQVYERRAGNVTHYRYKSVDEIVADRKNNNLEGTPFFVSTGLQLHEPDLEHTDAWELYEHSYRIRESNPTGVVIMMESLNDVALKALNIRQRLLAVALGLRRGPKLERAAFQGVFEKACEEASNRNCGEFGKLREPDEARAFFSGVREGKLEEVCNENVWNESSFSPKPGFI